MCWDRAADILSSQELRLPRLSGSAVIRGKLGYPRYPQPASLRNG